MQVSDIPSNLDELLSRLDLKKPRMCYTNCYLAVMNSISKKDFDIHYILGIATTSDGSTFDHALIKWNGNYYDPTLEPQGLHKSFSYSIEREFSPKEILQLMINKFGLSHIEEMIDGKQPFWPLVKTKSGEYDFEDV